MKLECPTCGTPAKPTSVVFDGEFIVCIDDQAAFDELVDKVGKDWFRSPTVAERA